MSDKFDYSTLETGFEAEWPVAVPTPIDGKMVERKLWLRLRAIGSDEIDEITRTAGSGAVMALCKQAFVGFGRDETATWSPEYRDRLLQSPRFREALFKAFCEFNTGAPSKN